MIRLQCIGLYKSDFSGGETRLGDSQIIDDGKNYEVIDGYCGAGTERLLTTLEDRKIKSPNLYITHPHYDHRYGIRAILKDKSFKPKRLYCQNPAVIKPYSDAIRSDIDALKTIISEAKARKIPVTYLSDGQSIVHGDIKFKVYFETPTYNGNSDAYLNDGSLSFWFPELKYLTTGDAGFACANKHNLYPVFIKGGHHGNRLDGYKLKPSQMAKWLYQHGCRFYWDNDYSESLTDFLQTGREDAQTAGMKILSIHGDINFIAQSGYVSIYKDNKVYRYKCAYKGQTALKQPNLDVVMDVLRGDCGSDNARISCVINRGYYPIATQDKVNEIIKLVRG